MVEASAPHSNYLKRWVYNVITCTTISVSETSTVLACVKCTPRCRCTSNIESSCQLYGCSLYLTDLFAPSACPWRMYYGARVDMPSEWYIMDNCFVFVLITRYIVPRPGCSEINWCKLLFICADTICKYML